MKAAIVSATPHAIWIDQDLLAHGISPEKWWAANEKHNGSILRVLLECHRREVSNRRFNLNVHNLVVRRKLDDYYRKLRKEMPEVFV